MKKLVIGKDVIANPHDREIFQRYLSELNKYKPLTREEEQELFKRIKEEKDQKAIELVCKHNLRFVVSVAKTYSKFLNNSTITLEDLIGEGNVGLVLAVERFNPESGNKFISYAVWWIRQCILAYIANNIKNIRLPMTVQTVIKKLKQREEQLEQKLGRAISSIELFDSLAGEELTNVYSHQSIDSLYEAYNSETSISTLIGDTTETIADSLKSEALDPYDALEIKEKNELTMKLLDGIPSTIQDYILDYFGLCGRDRLTLAEMSRKYDENSDTINNRMQKYLRRARFKNRNSRGYFVPEYESYLRQMYGRHDKNTIYLI